MEEEENLEQIPAGFPIQMLGFEPQKPTRMTKFDKIQMLQDSIKIVAGVAGSGVAVPGSGEFSKAEFFPLIDDEITKGRMNNYIADLTKLLVEQNVKMFK